MPLPPEVKVTKKARLIFAHLEEHPDSTLKEIQVACVVAKDTAHRWRQIWLDHREDLAEAPPPSVRHRVDAVDPTTVFQPLPPSRPKPRAKTTSQDPERDRPSDPAPPQQPSGKPKGEGSDGSDPEPKDPPRPRIREVRL